MNRRTLLTGAAATASLAVTARPSLAQAMTTLNVAYAGSMGALMEGPIKRDAAKRLDVTMQGRGQGATALAHLIVGGSLNPDVFISVTPSPMLMVLRAGKAKVARPIAKTAMVIAYSPKSRFAAQFADAGKPGAMPWWEILEQPGLRFGRTDPNVDPQGQYIIFTMQLAARYYHRPELVERVLGPTINPPQIFEEPIVEARLQAGELDAASAYKIQPGPFNLPYVELPEQINFGGDRYAEFYAHASLTLGTTTHHPEPLVYYAAVLEGAAHPRKAQAFVDWLTEPQGQAIFRHFNYDPPGAAAPLRG
ncbi:MAG: extracellular solute-binding protein [Vulcanimicrobiaceae bacterium]